MRITVDAVVVFGGEVVFIRRTKPPFMDKLVFPGGHVEDSDATLATACCRELLEEIGLAVEPEQLQFLTILDSADRDPRPERRVSIVYQVKLLTKPEMCAGSDAHTIELVHIDKVEKNMLGFDHFLAIQAIKNGGRQ